MTNRDREAPRIPVSRRPVRKPTAQDRINRLHPIRIRGQLQSYGVQELQLFAENGDVVLSVVGDQGSLCLPMPEKTANWLVDAIMDTIDELIAEDRRKLKEQRLGLER
jgi:hypothetical protein